MIALSLGIGLNATVFTLVNAVLIRGLPYKDAGRLYLLDSERRNGDHDATSFADLDDWRGQATSFAALAAWNDGRVNVSDDRSPPQSASRAALTANAFALLDVAPILGRDFTPADQRSGAEPVVIIGRKMWKSRYAEDPAHSR